MMNPTMALAPAASEVLPAAPCDRCGTFSDALKPFGTAKICPACLTRAATSARYWPAGYLSGVGALLNPAIAAILLSLNYGRLGDEKAARGWMIGGLVLSAFYLAIIILDVPIPSSALWPAGIVAGISIGRAFRPQWELLKGAGAQRANVWLPPVLGTAALIALGIVLVLVGEE